LQFNEVTPPKRVQRSGIQIMTPTDSGPRLLVVEDDGSIGKLLMELLSDECGWSTTLVTSAAEARCAVAHESFDLMFVDYGLPDGNGLDLVRWIRSLPGRQHPLACLVSALDREAMVKDAIQDGTIHCFMAKPFDLDEIVATVEEADLPRTPSNGAASGDGPIVH
jgi:DNA-binding response OmpR family regulator